MTEGPVALVTGTRKGLGTFLVRQLLDAGYRVVGCSRKPPEWDAEGYTHVCADVANEKEMGKVFKAVRALGRLDAVLNNAGIASMNHSLLTPLGSAQQIMSTNFLGTFLVARESAKPFWRK